MAAVGEGIKGRESLRPAGRWNPGPNLINPLSNPEDFARPGHVFPLRGCIAGVLERRRDTEAAIVLARLAVLYPAGVICEILNEDGKGA